MIVAIPASVAQQGQGVSALPYQAPAATLALWAANALRDAIVESDRTLVEHDAAIHVEELARVKLKAMLIATMADVDHPIVAGNVAFWVGGDGEIMSRAIEAVEGYIGGGAISEGAIGDGMGVF